MPLSDDSGSAPPPCGGPNGSASGSASPHMRLLAAIRHEGRGCAASPVGLEAHTYGVLLSLLFWALGSERDRAYAREQVERYLDSLQESEQEDTE